MRKAHDSQGYLNTYSYSMKKLLFLFPLLCSTFLYAQSIERSVIGAYGASGSNGSIEVDMTVGEVAVTTGQSGTLIVTQGFHQPDDGITGIEEPLSLLVDYSLYPNPTTDKLYLELAAENNTELLVEIVDVRGRNTPLEAVSLMVSGQVSTTEWDTSRLAEGMYMVVIKNSTGEINGSLRFQKR